jgi:hypothetical protein
MSISLTRKMKLDPSNVHLSVDSRGDIPTNDIRGIYQPFISASAAQKLILTQPIYTRFCNSPNFKSFDHPIDPS